MTTQHFTTVDWFEPYRSFSDEVSASTIRPIRLI